MGVVRALAKETRSNTSISAFSSKGCVWHGTPSAKSVCNGEELLRQIQHLKVNNEADQGRSLTEVCRISMRTRDLLDRMLQWLDSAMAEFHVQASHVGRVTEDEFIRVLRKHT